MLCDEDKYIKILSYDDVNKKFKIEKEFFVNNYFATNDDLNILENYSYSNGMLYNNNECYLLQERGTERIDTDTFISDDNGIFRIGTPSFPLCSNDFVLRLLQPNDYSYTHKAPFFLYLSPPLNSHRAKNGPAYGNELEFFSHSDPKKIIRFRKEYGYPMKLVAELCHLNGLVLNSQEVLCPNLFGEPLLSRNGRFVCAMATLEDGKYSSKVYEIGTLNNSETNSDNPYV